MIDSSRAPHASHRSHVGAQLPVLQRVTGVALGVIAATARRLLPSPPRGRAADPTAPRILVVRLDELGDMVLFSGFFRELRRRFPRAEVVLVAKPAAAEIVRGSPYIDQVVTFTGGPPRALRPLLMPFVAQRFVREALGGRRFDIAVQPRWDFDGMYAGWIAYASGAPERIAFSEDVSQRKSVYSRGLDALYTRVIRGRGVQHESDHVIDVLRALGADGDGSATEVWPVPLDPQRGETEILAPLSRDGRPIVAIGPSGGHSALKAWPVARFATAARELTNAGAHVVVLGAGADRVLAEALAREAGVAVTDLTGRTTLAQTVAVLDRSALYIGNDTGLLHIAVARGIRTISIFGSSPASLYGPRGAGHRVFWAQLPCGPLPTIGDHGGPTARGLRTERCARCIFPTLRCMEAIDPAAVVDAALELLDLTRSGDTPRHHHPATV